MPDPEIILEVDLETGEASMDLVGWLDQSCRKVDKAAEELGVKTNTQLKPEAHIAEKNPQKRATQQNK